MYHTCNIKVLFAAIYSKSISTSINLDEPPVSTYVLCTAEWIVVTCNLTDRRFGLSPTLPKIMPPPPI